MKSHLKISFKRIKKINNIVFVFLNHLTWREQICFSKNKVVFKIIWRLTWMERTTYCSGSVNILSIAKYHNFLAMKYIRTIRNILIFIWINRSLVLQPCTVNCPELKTLVWWILRLMLDLLFFLISRLNNACFPVVINLKIY